MNLTQLISRELLWYWRSPGLWWSLPLVLLSIAMLPQIMWLGTGGDIALVENLWNYLTLGWSVGGRNMIESNAIAATVLQPYLPTLEAVMAMSIEEVWVNFLVPALQLFCLLPLSQVIFPLTVTIFRRDMGNGSFEMHRINGGSTYAFVAGKLLALLAILFVLQTLAMFVFLLTMQTHEARAHLFGLGDVQWLGVWLGLGLSLALWAAIMSWWTCLINSNGCTEIYTSAAIAIVGVLVCLVAVKLWGWNPSTLWSLTAGSILLLPLGLVPISLRLSQRNALLP